MVWLKSLLTLLVLSTTAADYEANWDSLDSRPIPDWFDEAKIGIFIHWGVFSVPAVSSEWFWSNWVSNSSDDARYYIQNFVAPDFTYQEFAKDFQAGYFFPEQWVDIFRYSGAKYVILTSKHHEGYTLWPSKYSFSWNAMDVGPKRDLVGELSKAVTDAGLKFGLYHSLFEWYNPMYLADKTSGYETQEFVDKKVIPEMKELVSTYKPAILWSDGEFEAPDTYWKSTEFLAWLYNESPVKDDIITNDRWGSETPCKHGGYFTCHDKFNPGTLQARKWENAMTIDKYSWGFRRNARLADFLTPLELITQVVTTVSCGGNILINVGPTAYGWINPIFEERLNQLGDWLSINGEAIYGSKPWTSQNDTLNSNVWYTTRDNAVYAIVLEWPQDNEVTIGSVLELFLNNSNTSVTLLGNQEELQWGTNKETIQIVLPDKATVKSETAWVLKIT